VSELVVECGNFNRSFGLLFKRSLECLRGPGQILNAYFIKRRRHVIRRDMKHAAASLSSQCDFLDMYSFVSGGYLIQSRPHSGVWLDTVNRLILKLCGKV